MIKVPLPPCRDNGTLIMCCFLHNAKIADYALAISQPM